MNSQTPALPMVSRGWLVVPLLVAVGCIAAAAMIATDRWAVIFTDEGRTAHNGGRIVEATLRGAALWRVMLLISAAAIIGASLVFAHLCRPQPQRREKTPATHWIVGGCVVLALLVRLPRVNESFWYDELAVLIGFVRAGPGAIVGNYTDPGNHILHTLLSWCSIDPLGLGELTLRLPALIFALLTVPAMYAMSLRSGDRPAAVTAALLAAVMPVIVLEGVEARGYSMMIALSAIATWLLLKAVDEDRPWLWLMYALVCAAGAWTHPVAAFVPIGHAAWLFFSGVRRADWPLIARFTAAIMLAAILAVTLYSPALWDVLETRRRMSTATLNQPSIFGPEGLHALLQLGGSWSWWASIPGLILLVFGAILSWRDARARRVLLAAGAGLPIAALVIISSGAWMYARFLLLAMPAAIFAIALALVWLWRKQRAIALMVGAMLLGAYATDLVTRPPKQPLRDAVGYVAAHRAEGDGIGTIGLAVPVIDYYIGLHGLGEVTRDSGMHGLDARAMLHAHRPNWVIIYYPQRVRRDAMDALAEEGFTMDRRFRGWVDWTNGDVLVYRRQTSQQ